MARRAKAKRKPTSTTGKDASPRGGLKTKQTRVDNESETASPGPQQTKLSFAPSTTAKTVVPPTPRSQTNATSAAITPDPGKAARLNPDPGKAARLNTNDDMSIASTNSTEKTSKNTTKQKEKPTKKLTYLDATLQPGEQDAKPAATPSKTTAPKTKDTYQEIRYRGIIDTPPSEKPFEDFVLLLKKYLTTVQKVLGKHIYLAPWDSEQEATFPHLKLPSDVPESRDSIGIYLGNYINPKQDGSKIYMNLRWVTKKDPPVPLARFGMELADALPKLKMSMMKQPNPCQAVKSGCIGWFLYSSKQINSKTFVTETKTVLGIPDEVAIGISYRTITNEFGKKPPFNRDDPPPAAIHLDIDERYSMLFQQKAASLWRKNSKKRLPNGVQLRLVPCFSSPIGKSMTDDIRADAKTLAERQYFFVQEHLRPMEYHFISLLDTPLSPTDSMTLRRVMMARAPKNRPASRLIHNVDQSWNQPSKYMVTTVVGREEEVNRFLNNLIPEILYTYGPEASKWFSSQGLMVYKDVLWNPEKGTTSSSNSRASAVMVEEDLWDLGTKWKVIAANAPTTQRPDATHLDQAKGATANTPALPTPIQERLAGDKSVASFRDTFGRDMDSDDGRENDKLAAEEAAKPHEDLTGTQFIFSKEQLIREHERAINGSESDGKSMSTAGKTTGSTRLALKEAQEQIAELQLALNASKTPFQAIIDKANDEDAMETDSPPLSVENHAVPQALPPAPTIALAKPSLQQKAPKTVQIQDTHKEFSDAQLLRASLAGYRQDTIEEEDDAMEDDQHEVIHLGTYNSLPPLPSSSSESSSSSSSDTTHDTVELTQKLRSNPYNALRNHTSPKIPIQSDRSGGSKSDSASHQSSGQESGSSTDHTQEASSGTAGIIAHGAGPGD
jgi:hypothetical protein